MTTLSQIQAKIMAFKGYSSAKVPYYIGADYDTIEANNGIKNNTVVISWQGESPESQLLGGTYNREIEKITLYVTSSGDVIEESRLLSRELAGYSFTDDLSEVKTLYYIGATPIIRVGTNEQTIQLDFECQE